MDRKIELGNDIDLNLLLVLTRPGNIFPPQNDPADYNSLHAALVASVSHASQQERRNEPKTRPLAVDLGNDKSHRVKRKQDARDTDANEISTMYSQGTQRRQVRVLIWTDGVVTIHSRHQFERR